jgi:molecular chaperone GrpE
MSFPDEAVPAEEVTPETGSGTEPEAEDGEIWSEADSAAVEAEAGEGAGDGEGAADGIDGAEEPADPMTVLTRERDEYLLALQRTQADFENFRKRVTRMQSEESARASSGLVNKLLPALDTLDLAQAHQAESSADSEDAKALRAARSMLVDLLAKEGLERVDEADVAFDPAVHDAVARSEDESEGGEVVVEEVLRSGYRWKGQVLRPAMVRVRG